MKVFFRLLIITILVFIIFLSLAMDNVNINIEEIQAEDYIEPNYKNIELITNLYFVDDSYLRIEDRKIEVTSSDYENIILKQLDLGPKNKKYKTIFDLGIDVNSVETMNNTAFVNLSVSNQELENLIEDDNIVYLWSVVNSLTEKNNILNVQFLFNGERIDSKVDAFNLNEPLPRREDLIYTDEETPDDVVNDFIEYIFSGRYDLAYELLDSTSQLNIEYPNFIIITQEFSNKIKAYTNVLYFTQEYPDYWRLVYKYTDENGKIFYKNWIVIRENNEFKIRMKKVDGKFEL